MFASKFVSTNYDKKVRELVQIQVNLYLSIICYRPSIVSTQQRHCFEISLLMNQTRITHLVRFWLSIQTHKRGKTQIYCYYDPIQTQPTFLHATYLRYTQVLSSSLVPEMVSSFQVFQITLCMHFLFRSCVLNASP